MPGFFTLLLLIVTGFTTHRPPEGFFTAQENASFPFRELTGGFVSVHATLNDYEDSLNFILDTGSGAITAYRHLLKNAGKRVEFVL